MTKKRIALLLAMIMLISTVLVACGKKDNDVANTGTTETTEPAEPGAETSDEDVSDVENFADADTLVVAAPELNGSYINGFGNSTYDLWIKRVIGNYGGHLGYGTHYYDNAGEWYENPTVLAKPAETSLNEDGSKTYTMTINDNLVWNDGTPITAKDYVFATLFISSPEWKLTGASDNASAEDLVGFEEYNNGESEEFKGIQLIDDYTFSVTIKAEKIPYFYEITMANSAPRPLHRYSPNLDVVGGTLVVKEGYEISDEDTQALYEAQEQVIESAQKEYDEALDEYKNDEEVSAEAKAEYDALVEGDYNAILADEAQSEALEADHRSLLRLKAEVDAEEALLAGYKDGSIALSPKSTILTANANEVANVYRFNPDVTCGPYNFVEFKNNMAKVTLNDKFVGDNNGNKPTIKNIVVQTVNSKIDVDLAIAGTVDLASSITDGAKIDKAKSNEDAVSYSSYARNGYGLLNILTDMGATQHKGVRQAIAYSLDRNDFVQTIVGGYGLVVNGGFGIAQFEYAARGEEFNEKATNYTLNTDAANAALDTTPYLYEEDGSTPWDPAKAEELYNSNKEGFDYWRYDAEGNRLRVIHEGPINDVSDLIGVQLPDNTKLIGMQYIFSAVDFATLMDHRERPNADDPDQATVFNMGTGFGNPNDPYYQNHSSQIDVGDNKNRVNDPIVDEITVRMRSIDPTETEKWLDGWLEFQLWFNDYLPSIPLYANEYFDIHTNRVQNMETTPYYDWSSIICDLELAQ